jgi:fido (protein-threonine AMPylation protein)
MNISDFDQYIRQGEPSRKEKAHIWQTAIGLQDVDGLKPSQYLLANAKANIEGDITIAEVKKRLDSYYKQERKKIPHTLEGDRSEEADKVSANIAEILSEKTFVLSPTELVAIHRRLFSGVAGMRVKVGEYRDYNITKSEWVLDGATIYYAAADTIAETLAYDFGEEKKFKYKGLSKRETVERIAAFISGIWQIHPFGEGNTRTVAVFAIKYLRTFGYKAENDLFAKNSWYFRNALVSANYNDRQNNIHATNEFLLKFLGNLLLGEKNLLQNRRLHIRWQPSDDNLADIGATAKGSASAQTAFGQMFGVKFGVKLGANQKRILEMIAGNPYATAVEMAGKLQISKRAVEINIAKLKARGILTRIGADKNGHWQINKSAGLK